MATDYPYNDCGTLGFCPEPITLLGSAGSDESFRTLIAATRTTIYSSNDHNGNWRVLADGLGGGYEEEDCNTCSSRRFSMTQLGNYVLFTNNFDPVLAWKYGDPPSGLNLWSAQYVEDLLVIGITKARTITQYGGFVVVGNVDVEGVHKGNAIFWSDFNNPLSWVPTDFSLAGVMEFALDEKILRVETLGKFLMVYSDKRSYAGIFVGGDQVFQFTPIPTDNPLVYEHSLVNTGNAHLYGSNNGIYVVTASDLRPTRYEWMHGADAAIYSGVGADVLGGFEGLDSFGPINQEQCLQFISGYDPINEEVWFSWPTGDSVCPDMSLCFNLKYSAADLVDHGFTAFTPYKPDYRPVIRDWLNTEGVCSVNLGEFIKEGLPLEFDEGEPPLYLWNEMEDPTQTIDPQSWCARLGSTTESDLCDDCESSPVFIGASAEDFTLKEFSSEVYYREMYNNELGTYSQAGYYSLLQSDMSQLGSAEEKQFKQLLIDYVAQDQEPPSDLVGQVAYGSQPKCPTWKNAGSRELRCLTEATAQQHDSNNTRPDLAAKYQVWYRGRYLAWRAWVAGIGGAACFSRIVLTVSKAQGRTH